MWTWIRGHWTATGKFATVLVTLVTLVALVAQTRMSAHSLKDTKITGQVQYNLQIMERLDDVLVRISKDSASAKYVWSNSLSPATPPDSSLALQNGDSLLDVLSMALKALHCIPGFSTNGDDWTSYVRYVMLHSPNLKRRVNEQYDWWPELDFYAGVQGVAFSKCS
jgi:hypothetical protein